MTADTVRVLDDRQLDALRQVGDPEADQLAALLRRQRPELDERDLVRLVLDQIRPSTETNDEYVLDWLLEGPSWPDWADPELVRTGQDFFCDWPLPISTSLFCVSLPSAYAAAFGTQVLAMTSDLATRNLARRIAETGQMLFDVMNPGQESHRGLEPGGQGYLTIRGVRLLHGVVRQTLLATQDSDQPRDDDRNGSTPLRWQPEWGRPVNQEDLLGTLLTFTVAVFHGMDRLGIPYRADAADAYLHAWCVVGHLLGIQSDLLPLDRCSAEALTDVIARRHHRRSHAGTRLTAALLHEMELAMPLGLRKLPRTLIWRMLPAEVAELLDVPPAAWWQPVVGLMARTGPMITRLPGGRQLVQIPTALLGRAMLRMLIERSLQGEQPAFRLDAAVLDQLSLRTSPIRQSMRCRRRRIRAGR